MAGNPARRDLLLPNADTVRSSHPRHGKPAKLTTSYLLRAKASENAIKKAFKSGDDDGDDTLSVSEASQALEKLSGRSVNEGTIKSACSKCGIDTSREMDCELSQTRRSLAPTAPSLWLIDEVSFS